MLLLCYNIYSGTYLKQVRTETINLPVSKFNSFKLDYPELQIKGYYKGHFFCVRKFFDTEDGWAFDKMDSFFFEKGVLDNAKLFELVIWIDKASHLDDPVYVEFLKLDK